MARVSAQSIAAVGESGENAAPEPYAYGYETDSHAASEQRDQSGKVTGFYTLTDADGRARRVEYYADESGFHANVQTNEVGTKSDNPADVQILASPPTEAQFVYQAQNYVQQAPPSQQVLVQQAPQQQQQTVTYQYKPAVGGVSYQYQPGYTYGYSSQYQPASTYGYTTEYQAPGSVYQSVTPGVVTSTTSNTGSLGVANGAVYGGYNYHLPASYYEARSRGVIQPAQVGAIGGTTTVSRYTSQPAVYKSVTVPGAASGSYKYQSYSSSGPIVTSGVAGVPGVGIAGVRK